MAAIEIFLLGERQRGDDGVAFDVAEALLEALPRELHTSIALHDSGQLMPDALLDCAGPIIIVDAVSGPPAGRLVDVSLSALLDRRYPWQTASSHAVPVEMALAIAAHLGGEVPRGRFIGVAGSAYALGDRMTDAVREAVPVAAARVASWIAVLNGARRNARCA